MFVLVCSLAHNVQNVLYVPFLCRLKNELMDLLCIPKANIEISYFSRQALYLSQYLLIEEEP